MGGMMGTRLPIGGFELAVSLLVAADCLALNALAVAHLPELSLDALGPLALAYNDKQPPAVFAAVLVSVVLLGSWLPRVGRAAVLVFAGAAAANFVSPLIWDAGAPDYIVFREIDLIANVSDVLMIGAGSVVVGVIVVESVRAARRQAGR